MSTAQTRRWSPERRADPDPARPWIFAAIVLLDLAALTALAAVVCWLLGTSLAAVGAGAWGWVEGL